LEIDKLILDLPAAIQTCIKEKSCTFSTTRRNFTRQIYYSCDDCGSDFGLCYVCHIYCHKDGPYAKHKVNESHKNGDFYCDCGAGGEGTCCSLPGSKRQVEPAAPVVDAAATVKAATAAVSASSDFKSVPHSKASDTEPSWSYDLSDRRMPMKLKTALQTHNDASKHLNAAFAKRTSWLPSLDGKDCSFYHIRGCLKDIYSDMKYSSNWYERAVKEIDEHERNHPLKTELAKHFEEMMAFVEKEYADWVAKADWAECTAKIASLTEYLEEKLKSAREPNSEGHVNSYQVNPVLEQYGRIEEFFAENPKFEHPMRKQVSVDKAKFTKDTIASMLKAFTFYISSEYHTYSAEAYRTTLTDIAPNSPELKQMEKVEQEQKVKKEKAEAEKKVQQEKYAAEEKIRIAAQRKKNKETFMDPYKGGTIRVGRGEVWNYAADGTLSTGNIKMIWNGTDLEGNVLGYGGWSADNFQYTYNGRIFASYDWSGSPTNTFNPHFTTGARPIWTWNGTHLTTNENGWQKDTCVVEGSVPLPCVLFAALKAYLVKMTSLFNGEGKCGATLWNEGTACSLCDNCRQADNFRDGCAVCTTSIMFPKNRAYVCKTCVNYLSYCARCGVIGARHAAFICDDCQYNWKDKCCRKR